MLKDKNVWIILSGEFIAGIGLWLGIIGNLEFLQEKIPSDFLKSLLLATGLLAGIAVGPLAGKLTDRYSKKKIMLIAGFIRVVSVLFMFIALSTGSIWWMIGFLILIQISAAFYFPALQAAIPLIVAEKDLLKLNGIHMNVSTLSRIAGTALAGLLLVLVPLYIVYAASFVGYIILFILTMFININEDHHIRPVMEKSDSSTSFKDVFPVIKKLPIVYMTLLMTLIPTLFLGGFNLIVINISELQESSMIKGLIYTTEGVSFMLGAFLINRLTEKMSAFTILFVTSFFIGFSQVMLYFANSPAITILTFLIFGFSVGCFFPTVATIFQTKIPKDYHGRFFSFRNMLDRVTFQIVLLLTGLLLDIMGLQQMCVLFGMLAITTTLLFYITSTKIKQLNNS
ncbi:MFS transporter [Bacillus marasmi]|uniref:MFS transporter n=1 Tax=Bacillus marasmi TaxID=1926279 RepID=UPI0011CB9707|nr:MFS transporter [Bacillus marasmi]